MERLNIPPDVPVESKVVTRAIRSAQTQVEQQNFEIRKDVLKYDDVMNRQRVVIYGERRKVLEGADLHEQISEFVDEVIEGYVEGETSEGCRCRVTRALVGSPPYLSKNPNSGTWGAPQGHRLRAPTSGGGWSLGC